MITALLTAALTHAGAMGAAHAPADDRDHDPATLTHLRLQVVVLEHEPRPAPANGVQHAEQLPDVLLSPSITHTEELHWEFADVRAGVPAWNVKATVLSKPVVQTATGDRTVLFVGSSVPFLTASVDGCWIVREENWAREGVSLELTPEAQEQGILMSYEIRRALVIGREDVEGTSLPVGRPIIASDGRRSRMHVPEGRTLIVTLPPSRPHRTGLSVLITPTRIHP